ncbi:hypothetical protein SARC_04124 [Sphaeroforma arctica JP610]|uniref:Uncharacterized protein n=1 Tax=Sphaeroforma arctica JP610 TaxID=667725 RepID=A0A0L0G3K2_9EUKA|nr:hypothetical protein SARC_04124 [Sphaeroforma arctica JP610]KNC83625.1 hypothetical protein SARC_04124 [Sphaeroforma arctica JP610]|eukprot:XP_014157527.1 hypothetical protein SARC_04124 [Sphaeroforma arctica JP610]
MHPEPPREKLLNKVSKQMAQRKANRTPKPTHLAAHTPSSLRNSATPYGNLSPAARLLMDRTLDKKTIGAPSKLGRGTPKASRGTGIGTGKFGSFGDGALRQAYASPAHTVVAGSRKRTHSTSQRSGATPSITDGLLDSTPQAKYTR